MTRVHQTFSFEVKIGIPTIWAQGTPSFRKQMAEMCYLYRRKGHLCYTHPSISRSDKADWLSHARSIPPRLELIMHLGAVRMGVESWPGIFTYTLVTCVMLQLFFVTARRSHSYLCSALARLAGMSSTQFDSCGRTKIAGARVLASHTGYLLPQTDTKGRGGGGE